MSERMTAQLVCDALQMALWRRRMPSGVIVHSDRGTTQILDVSKRHDRGVASSLVGLSQAPPKVPLTLVIRRGRVDWQHFSCCGVV